MCRVVTKPSIDLILSPRFVDWQRCALAPKVARVSASMWSEIMIPNNHLVKALKDIVQEFSLNCPQRSPFQPSSPFNIQRCPQSNPHAKPPIRSFLKKCLCFWLSRCRVHTRHCPSSSAHRPNTTFHARRLITSFASALTSVVKNF